MYGLTSSLRWRDVEIPDVGEVDPSTRVGLIESRPFEREMILVVALQDQTRGRRKG
jgi:hypothetical protein